ncbi:MAG TPA: hypothetical protein DDW52_05760 [Planctomycetaceae bacterium]|nr:hypothetical protein [Planctomycetaceae bacterium]
MESVYPKGLAERVKARWPELNISASHLPEPGPLADLIDIAYQTSLLEEESRHVTARIAFLDRSDSVAASAPLSTPLEFDAPIPLTPHSVRKLAAAVSYFRSLLKVGLNASGGWQIQGMVTTGTHWINHDAGPHDQAGSLPACLIVHVNGPGHLLITYGAQRVLESHGGMVLEDAFDPFRSAWLPRRFVKVRESLLADLPATVQQGSSQICESFVKDFAQSVVRRALRLSRTRRHGGMLVYLPLGDEGERIADDWFRFRVRFKPNDHTKRFRQMMLRLMERAHQVGTRHGLQVITWDDYQHMDDTELMKIDRELIEFAHLLADLMDIDGSLVLDRSFRLIGFGAEILGDSHAKVVHRAIDLEATQAAPEAADSAGTRHRSAYRLVNGVPDAVAVVVSQDGDVRFVANQNDRTTYWPYLP